MKLEIKLCRIKQWATLTLIKARWHCSDLWTGPGALCGVLRGQSSYPKICLATSEQALSLWMGSGMDKESKWDCTYWTLWSKLISLCHRCYPSNHNLVFPLVRGTVWGARSAARPTLSQYRIVRLSRSKVFWHFAKLGVGNNMMTLFVC